MEDSNSETSAQIMPLKSRADFLDSTRIPATETIRVGGGKTQLGPIRISARFFARAPDHRGPPAPAPASNSPAWCNSPSALPAAALWTKPAPWRFAYACAWTCQNSSRWGRRNIAPPPPKPRGGRRALAGERSKPSGLLVRTTTHAPLAGKVQGEVRNCVVNCSRRIAWIRAKSHQLLRCRPSTSIGARKPLL
jgi:hypothetical protein